MPSRPRLPAKLTRPAASGLIRRERLFRQIDEGLRRKLLWISGPAGAGKTSLVSTYIETRRLRSVWYQIDARDADLAAFFHYLRLAAQGRGGGEPLPVFAAEHAAGLEAFSRRFFEAFFARFPEQITFVFDGYHEAAADSRIHEVTLAFLCELPGHARAVAISRGNPPAQLARWVASAEFAAVDREQLAFSLEESTALAGIGGIREAADVARLQQISRGWAAGMMLMLRAARGGLAPLAPSADSPPELLFGYFANEIFARIPAPQREFLQKTAFVPHLTPALAERLTGEPRAGRILADLNRDNFFTERKSHAEAIYEYHPLFREFLQSHAAESLGAAEVAALRTRAASLLESEGQIDVAAQLLSEAKDWGRLKSFVHRYADDMTGRGRFQTLRGWIEAIPPEVAAEAPWVLLWKGICQAGAQEAPYLDTVRRACALFDGAGDSVGSFASRFWLMRLSSSASDLEARLSELAAIADRATDPEIEARILEIFGRFRFDARLSCEHPLLSRWIARAAELARVHPDPLLRLRMANFVGSAVSLAGDYVRLDALVAEHRRLLDDPRVGAGERVNFMLVTALLRASQGMWEETAAIIARVRELVEATGIPASEATLIIAALRCHISLGDMDAARAALDRLALLAGASGMARIHFLTASIHVRVAEGKTEEAGEALAELTRLVPQGASHRPMVENLSGLILLERGDFAEAAAQLRAAVSLARERRHLTCLYPALLSCALAEWRAGAREAALRQLAEGLALGRRARLRVGSTILPRRRVAEVCELALRNSVEVEIARDLVAALRLEPPDDAPDLWPWPVRVRLLGGFDIERGSAAAERSSGRKQPKKPFELLKYLVAHGGSKVAAGPAIDALWPQAEGDAGKKSFEIALHRLRKLLGSDAAIRLEGGQLSLDPGICWVDSLVFERLARKADSGNGEGDRSDELAGRALALFRGGFLPGDEQAWASPCRDKLRALFVRLAGSAGERLESRGATSEAERWYRKALDLDPTAEAIYRRLMQTLASQGRAAEATEIYRRCREMLSIVLSAKPSPETEAAYRRFRNG
jgi:ATP/maltotriose-dependent transcriptional regulator MalT/DNA-binding SARP family transcriptional activator